MVRLARTRRVRDRIHRRSLIWRAARPGHRASARAPGEVLVGFRPGSGAFMAVVVVCGLIVGTAAGFRLRSMASRPLAPSTPGGREQELGLQSPAASPLPERPETTPITRLPLSTSPLLGPSGSDSRRSLRSFPPSSGLDRFADVAAAVTPAVV